MSFVTTKDDVRIFFKDWGPKTAQPVVFHHGWPLSADDWDAQMLFFVNKGYRVVAHDRRGHGRSDQVGDGHDMDHYAADAAAVVEHLDLLEAVPEENVFTLRNDSLGRLLADALGSIRALRRLRIDTVLDCELFSRVSAILSFLTGAKRRVGFEA